MKNNFKKISISSLFILSSIFLQINSFEVEGFVFPLNTEKNKLITSRGNIRTVITIGYGKTIEEASQNAAETALKQVVGSFIDSETLISKKKEISNGIVKLSKTIKRDTQDYSQGIIKYFEVLKTEERNGIFIVEAKVEVLEGEFSNYIKEFAFSESSFPGDQLSIMIQTNEENKQSKAKLITQKIVKPLEEGSVYDLKLEKFIFSTDWDSFCTYNENEGYFKENFCREIYYSFNKPQSDFVVVPMMMKLDDAFLNNAVNILNNIKYKKIKVGSIDENTYSNFSNLREDDLMIAVTKKNNQIATIYLIKDVKKIIQKERLNKYPNRTETNSHPLLKTWGRYNLARYKSGVKDYGGMVVKLLDSENRVISRLICNAYECPNNEKIQILHTSQGVDPQFSLFGCYQQGNACIPTIINKSRYLVVLNFQPKILEKIKNIKVEYQNSTNYLPGNRIDYLF